MAQLLSFTMSCRCTMTVLTVRPPSIRIQVHDQDLWLSVETRIRVRSDQIVEHEIQKAGVRAGREEFDRHKSHKSRRRRQETQTRQSGPSASETRPAPRRPDRNLNLHKKFAADAHRAHDLRLSSSSRRLG